TDRAPCGSKSTSSTRRPCSASAAPRLIVVVVLPTPPFWLQMAAILAGPCESTGSGSGNTGMGRPVGPSTPGLTSKVRDAATANCPSPGIAVNALAGTGTLSAPQGCGKPTHRLRGNDSATTYTDSALFPPKIRPHRTSFSADRARVGGRVYLAQ